MNRLLSRNTMLATVASATTVVVAGGLALASCGGGESSSAPEIPATMANGMVVCNAYNASTIGLTFKQLAEVSAAIEAQDRPGVEIHVFEDELPDLAKSFACAELDPTSKKPNGNFRLLLSASGVCQLEVITC